MLSYKDLGETSGIIFEKMADRADFPLDFSGRIAYIII